MPGSFSISRVCTAEVPAWGAREPRLKNWVARAGASRPAVDYGGFQRRCRSGDCSVDGPERRACETRR